MLDTIAVAEYIQSMFFRPLIEERMARTRKIGDNLGEDGKEVKRRALALSEVAGVLNL